MEMMGYTGMRYMKVVQQPVELKGGGRDEGNGLDDPLEQPVISNASHQYFGQNVPIQDRKREARAASDSFSSRSEST